MQKTVETLESVVVRFVGDSGDGMQLTGSQFTETTALAGNDLATFPDFPAEIRAPAGTIAGVSGFQIRFSSSEIFTPGDEPDALVAMNPAALKVNVGDLRKGGILIANTAEFTKKNLDRVGYTSDPLTDGSLSAFRLFPIDITGHTLRALQDLALPKSTAERSKNFFALGLVYWLFHRDKGHTEEWIRKKFGKKEPEAVEANLRALKAGHVFGEVTEAFQHSYIVPVAKSIEPGLYRNISGNEALAMGLLAGAERSGRPLFLGSYPITPASDILHFLSAHKHMGTTIFQAEDEIAAMAAAIGAAYAGSLAVTTTSGPGLALKSEGMSLAMMLELPMVIVDVQRGGPSTGLPTKTEQSDLLQAMFGRHGESPLPIIASSSPGDCFWTAVEACRIALRHMTPVILLSDGYLANGAEPFRIPDVSAIPALGNHLTTDAASFKPYGRDDDLARPWALPGTPGLEHRIGGLEKQNITGNISYDSANHELMSKLRAERVQRIARHYEPTEIFGGGQGDLLIVGWGGTFGALRAATRTLRAAGRKVSHLHLRHLNPLPTDLGDILRAFRRVLVPELNLGQLAMLMRARYLVDCESLTKVQGKPFRESEIVSAATARLEAQS